MQTVETTLGTLSEAVTMEKIANPAIILIRSDKSVQQPSSVNAAA
jgi:siroheme synthase